MKAWLILLLIGTTTAGTVLADEVDYLRDVKPILMEKCSSCHGALKQEADLRLDAGSLIHQGGAEGQVIEPGNALNSKLILRISDADPELRMPPDDGVGEPLNSSQVELLNKWIDQGAVVPEQESIPADPANHWAYQAPRKVPLPTFPGVSNPVDLLIQNQYQSAGLEPVEPADRLTLLRRVYFDLIGLPPTREQLDAFSRDDSPADWEKTVDELLDRPQYGERWGRHWMDVWRYSDWDGYKQELRGSQRHIWHWRDWIIDSLNSDKPYDQMIVEMLAADEVASTNRETLAATGFLARNYHISNRNIWLDATVEHTAKAFLGMTLNCARCHDHKYDPISQEMYYEFRAIFEPHQVRTDRLPGQADLRQDGLPRAFDAELAAATYVYAGGDEKNPLKDLPIQPRSPTFLGGGFKVKPVPLPVESWFPAFREFILTEERTRLKKQLDDAERNLKDSVLITDESVSLDYAIVALEYAAARLSIDSWDARVAAERANIDQMESAGQLSKLAASTERRLNFKQAELALARKQLALQTAQAATPTDSKQNKAVVDKTAKELAAATNSLGTARVELTKTDGVFSPVGKKYPQTSSGRRSALARWITARKNPLAARVAVNQIWMRHFGVPLVENVFDFGLRSPSPRHVELLDWLAVEFVEHDWSMKHLHRLILTSRTWQLASSSTSKTAMKNREFDPENQFLWRANPRRLDAELVRDNVLSVSGQIDLSVGGPDIDFRKGETTRRRSIYLRHAYEKQMRMLVLFDTANPNECYRRSESIIPQQALAMVNSSLCQDQSRLLARQLWSEVENSDEEKNARFLGAAFEQVLGRPPGRAELADCVEFLDSQKELLSKPDQLTKLTVGKPAGVKPADDPGGRARENLIHVLMNHNDFVTIR